jgi:polyhydroxybutyrate depolymerase
MRWIRKPLAAMCLALIAQHAATADDGAQPCGTEEPCHIASGSYYAKPPSGWDGESTLPVVIYFHGYKQSGRTVLGMKALMRAADESGILVVAPNGTEGRWSVRGAPSTLRDDIAFARDLVHDISTKWPVDLKRLWVSGFSLGGSMAWDVACLSGDLFTGFMPVSGAFWRPHPTDCPSGPVTMLHVHGRGDKVVPLEGRTIRDRWRQGNVLEGFEFWRTHDRCGGDEVESTGDRGLYCREWRNCSGGKRLALCLYDGGHAAPKDWYPKAFRWLQETVPPRG